MALQPVMARPQEQNKKAAEQEGAGHPSGMDGLRASAAHLLLNPQKRVPINDGWPSVLYSHRRLRTTDCRVIPPCTPDQGPAVGFVGKYLVYRDPAPAFPIGGPQTFTVESFGYLFAADVSGRQLEYSTHRLHCHGILRLQLQLVPGLAAILDLHPAISIRCTAAAEEPPGGVLSQATPDVLPHVGRVELIDGLDDAFDQTSRRAIVGGFIDGYDLDAFVPEQGLVGYGIGPAATEAIQLPDQDSFKRRILQPGQGYHLLERRPRGSAAALRFVNEFPHYLMAILLGILSQRPQLG